MSLERDNLEHFLKKRGDSLYLRLSPYTWRILDNDRQCFYELGESISYSTFVERVLTHFYNYRTDLYTVESSVYHACKYRLPNSTPEDTNWIALEKELIKKVKARTQFLHKKRPNNTANSDDPLNDLPDIHYKVGMFEFIGKPVLSKYNKVRDPRDPAKWEFIKAELSVIEKTTGSKPIYLYNDFRDYLCALLEEYAGLPYSLRERIFFRDICEEIESAQKLYQGACEIRFTTQDGRSYKLKPYSTPVLSDTLLPYNYLVGFSSPVDSPESALAVNSFRLSMIRSIDDIVKLDLKQTTATEAESNAQIDRALRLYGVAYLSAIYHPDSAWITAEVEFSPQGVSDLRRRLANRPQCERKPDCTPGSASTSSSAPNKTEVWLLTGYEWKLELYLMPFGADARILRAWRVQNDFDTYKLHNQSYSPYDAPVDLKNKLAARHYQAFLAYYPEASQEVRFPPELSTYLAPLPQDGYPVDAQKRRYDAFVKVMSSLPEVPQRENYPSEEDYSKAAFDFWRIFCTKMFSFLDTFEKFATNQPKNSLPAIPNDLISRFVLSPNDDSDKDDNEE